MLSTRLKVFLILLGIIISFIPPVDPDFGWHYTLGETITATKAIPVTNTFSYTYENYEWVDSYWLAQVIMYTVYSKFGAVIAGLVLSCFLSVSVLFFVDRLKVTKTGKLFSFFLLTTVLAQIHIVTVRPMLFSSIFMMVLLLIMHGEKKYYLLLPPMFVLWANMHADFVIGLFILTGIGLVKPFAQLAVWQKLPKFPPKATTTDADTDISPAGNKKLIFVTILCYAATLLTPFGLNLWRTLLAEANPVQVKIISEWLPFQNSLGLNGLVFGAVILMLTALCISSTFLTVRTLPKWVLVFAIFFFILSTRSHYFFRLLMLVSIYPIASMWGYVLENANVIFSQKNQKALSITGKITAATLLSVITTNFILNILLATNVKYWAAKFNYPYNAVQYIKANRLEGNMFNNYNWGGFLIYQLPEYKTFIDGRMASWTKNGKYILETYSNITQNPEKNMAEFNQIVQNNDVGFVLDYKGSKLSKALLTNGAWKEKFSDKTTIILVRE